MFEFEDGSCERVSGRSRDAYDMELGLALSASLRPTPGAQILPPCEMHRLARKRLSALIGRQLPEAYNAGLRVPARTNRLI